MYEFIDVTEQSPVNSLPTEAVSIDGQYIEEAIPGYRTLYTKGRESLTREITSYSVGAAHGERVRSMRFEARVLTVGFQLLAPTAESFRERFNVLNNILSSEESDFIFNDEPDKYFTGIPVFEYEIEEGSNNVTGEWKIFCGYPFKRSLDVITKSSTDVEGVVVNDTSAVFTINYNGTIPTKPVLQAEFAGRLSGGDVSEDGDCGFVAFMDSNENIIQLGNPEDPETAQATAETVCNRVFSTVSGWTDGASTSVFGNYAVSGSCSAGNLSDPQWDKGKGQTQSYAKPSYGSSTASCAGPVLSFGAPADLSVKGPDFGLKLVHRLCCNNTAELGEFQCVIRDDANRAIAGILITKSTAGDKGTVKYIVNGVSVGSATIDLSYNNNNFGYCKKTAIYTTQYYNKKKKKWQSTKIKGAKTRKVVDKYTYTQSSLITSIVKQGDAFTFKVGNLAAKTFKDSSLETLTSIKYVTIHFGKYKGKTALHTNAVHSVMLTTHPTSFGSIKNTFSAGDIVEADCNDASVYLMRANTVDGQPAPQYGALGNDWDDFSLTYGTNTVAVTWSDWVNPAYKPTIRIMYNEVFI